MANRPTKVVRIRKPVWSFRIPKAAPVLVTCCRRTGQPSGQVSPRSMNVRTSPLLAWSRAKTTRAEPRKRAGRNRDLARAGVGVPVASAVRIALDDSTQERCPLAPSGGDAVGRISDTHRFDASYGRLLS